MWEDGDGYQAGRSSWCQSFPMESDDPLQGHKINVIASDQYYSQKWTSTENSKAIEEYYQVRLHESSLSVSLSLSV